VNASEVVDSLKPAEISTFVELIKPLNRNVWEYDPDFMSNNDLSIPDPDDKEAIKKIQDLFIAQNGKKGYKAQNVENKVKLFNKDDDRMVCVHNEHLKHFREVIANKLNDSEEFLNLFHK